MGSYSRVVCRKRIDHRPRVPGTDEASFPQGHLPTANRSIRFRPQGWPKHCSSHHALSTATLAWGQADLSLPYCRHRRHLAKSQDSKTFLTRLVHIYQFGSENASLVLVHYYHGRGIASLTTFHSVHALLHSHLKHSS